MSYSANIPQASDDPSQSQSQILSNFQAIATVNAVNHVAFNLSGEGKHKFLQMPEQSSAPATAANEGGLYTKENGGVTELFFRRESNGNELQLTGDFTSATVDGQFVIPGGLVVKWGFRSGLSDNSSVTFSSPFATTINNIMLTLVRNDTNNRFVYVKSASSSVSGFSIRTNATSTDMYFIAIGS